MKKKKEYVTPNIQSIEIDTTNLLRASQYDNEEGSDDSSDRSNIDDNDEDGFEAG